MMRVPEPGGRYERRARPPVGTPAVDDVPSVVELLTDQSVAAGLAVDDEIQGDRLVVVGELNGAGGQDAEHGPDHMGDRPGLREFLVGQENAYPAFLRRVGVVLHPL